MCAWAWGDSFDCYAAPADMLNGYWDSGTINLGATSLVAGRFSGSLALLFGTATNTTAIKSSGANDSVHHLVVAFRQNQAITGTTLASYLQLFDGVTAQCSVVFRSDGAILLTSGAPGGSVLATYASAFPVMNTWYAFEFEVVVHNSTGSFKVRKNGNTVDDHSTTGIDTAGGTANNYANKLQIGINATLASGGQNIDDLYWRSDASSLPWWGDIKCMARAPASDAAVQFSRTPTSAQMNSATSGTVSAAANNARFVSFVATYTGTISTAILYANAAATANVKTTLYDNTVSNVPGNVLGSANVLVNPAAGVNTVTWAAPVAVVRGSTYWLATDQDATVVWTGATSSGGSSATVTYASFPTANPVVTSSQASLRYTINIGNSLNYETVNEPQQDTTTSYVYDSVPGHADLYGIAAIASTPLTTFAVTTRAYAIKSDAGTRTMAVQLKSGGTTVASPTLVLTTSNWQWAWRTDVVDPETSAPWTAAAVNLVQVGPKCVA